jgi:hypothetical protein
VWEGTVSITFQHYRHWLIGWQDEQVINPPSSASIG